MNALMISPLTELGLRLAKRRGGVEKRTVRGPGGGPAGFISPAAKAQK